MLLKLLESEFAVCKVQDFSLVDLNATTIFLAKTDKEYSVVCPTDQIPANCLELERPWRAIRVEGQLDFSLIGIIARISAILADSRIGIFVVSTFDTDYLLVKSHQLSDTVKALDYNGYKFV